MCAPDYTHSAALPDFVLEKVPKVDSILKDQSEARSAKRYLENPHSKYQPRYDDPFFQSAFADLVGELAAEFDGNPQIEFIDTFMYGFWGEGHTWPFANNPFPDYQTAERTWMHMMEVQIENFKKTPLLTNTQPDFSRVGNSEMLDRSVRSNNWIRSDTIFIENEQIEALSNRPPWIAALARTRAAGQTARCVRVDRRHFARGKYDFARHRHRRELLGRCGISIRSTRRICRPTIRLIPRRSIASTGASAIACGRRLSGATRTPGISDLIIGFANDGIAGVPGVLRVTVESKDGKVLQSGCLDPGYPLPGKIRQAQLVLAARHASSKGLKLRAEIEVKGMRYPVRWACHQKLNDDGSLTLRKNLRQAV